MSEITAVDAWEVLDSRGHPTVRACVETSGASGTFTVPAGASTGQHEAVERRDGTDRYGGRGVFDAVAAVTDELAEVVVGRDVTEQAAVDGAMTAHDGTDDLSSVGANAVLAVSGAVAHAASAVRDQPLHAYLADSTENEQSLPTPMVNVVSGGLHAEGGIEIQDFLVVPSGATTYSAALETVWDVRDAVRTLVVEAGHRPLVADEGGFAPPLPDVTAAFELLTAGIREAGYEPGDQVALAVDVAATHFYDETSDTYRLESLGRTFTSEELTSLVVEWTEAYPLVSVEDPLAEDDWEGWRQLAARLDDAVQLLGDDLLVTNRDRLARAVETDAASAVLVKPNQAGTLSRAMAVVSDAKDASVAPVVSARSGETCDTTIADLAVGLDAGQIKVGSLARSERLAKYNRLREIERTTESEFENPFASD